MNEYLITRDNDSSFEMQLMKMSHVYYEKQSKKCQTIDLDEPLIDAQVMANSLKSVPC
jgi:hypothetical protein